MSEFDLYTQLLKHKNNIINQDVIEPVISECKHTHIAMEHGASLCLDCGIEITQRLNFDKEWKYYGLNDTKHTSDPSRCYIRKVKDRTIYQDVEHMNISDHIKDLANDIYIQVCGDKVHRGAYRRAIVFASIFHAYKLNHNPQSCESLIEVFKIKRKDALKGLKFISEHAPSDSPLRTIYITPEHLIYEFMKKFNASIEQTREVVELYKSLKGKSSMLNRSRPQSTASGVIWYYMRITNREMSIKDFIKKVHLSELTVNKIAREVARIKENTNW